MNGKDKKSTTNLSKEKKELWQKASSDPNNKNNTTAIVMAGKIVENLPEDPFAVVTDEKTEKCKQKFNEIISLIVCGKNIKEIAEELSLDYFSLFKLKIDETYAPYFKKAFQLSAEMDVIRAEELLINFLDSESDNMAEAGVTRELSLFFRWRAERRNQEEFGRKQEIKTDVEIKVSNKVSDQTEFNDLISAIKERKRIEDEKKNQQGEYIDYEEK